MIAGIVGVLLFSTKAIFAKLAYLEGANAITTLGLRMAFSMPVYLYIAYSLGKSPEKSQKSDYRWILFFGLIGYYTASYLDFKGLEYIKASLERLILFIYPTLVIIMGFFIFRERISLSQLIGVVITYLGIIVVFFPELEQDDTRKVITGGILVFLSALTYGSYLVGSGWLIPRWGATRFTTYAMLIATTAVLIHYLIESGGIGPIFDLTGKVYFFAFCMAIFSTVLPSYLISYAIKGLGSSQFAVFASLGPISTIVLAYYFLNERLSPQQLLGGLVVISGVFIAEQFRAKVKKV